MPLELFLAEQNFPFFALGRFAPHFVRQMRQAALHCRPGLDCVVPLLELRKIGEILTLRPVMPKPGVGCDVDDRIFAGEIGNLAQPPIDDAVDAARLAALFELFESRLFIS